MEQEIQIGLELLVTGCPEDGNCPCAFIHGAQSKLEYGPVHAISDDLVIVNHAKSTVDKILLFRLVVVLIDFALVGGVGLVGR